MEGRCVGAAVHNCVERIIGAVVGVEEVAAKAENGAHLVEPLCLVLDIERGVALADGVRAVCRQVLPVGGVVEAEVYLIPARGRADRVLHVEATELAVGGVAGVPAFNDAVVVLVELIAVDRIGQEKGEVVVEVHAACDRVEAHLDLAVLVGVDVAAADAVALHVAAIAGIHRPEPAELSRVHQHERYLVCRGPFAAVGHAGERPTARVRPHGVAQHAIEFAEVVRRRPGAVEMFAFEGRDHVAVGDWPGHRRHAAKISKAAEGNLGHVVVELVDIIHLHRAGRGEIPQIGEVGTLLVFHAAQQFRDHEIEIGVALAMTLRRHVDGHVVDGNRDVRAVVEVEATQIILVGLPLAAVLRDDQSGHVFQKLAGAVGRSRRQLLWKHSALGRRVGRSRQTRGGFVSRFVAIGDNFDRWQLNCLGAAGAKRAGQGDANKGRGASDKPARPPACLWMYSGTILTPTRANSTERHNLNHATPPRMIYLMFFHKPEGNYEIKPYFSYK